MTKEEALALLPEYALEVLSPEERAAVDGWLADPDVAAELSEIQEGLGAVAMGLAPVAPSAEARSRLMVAAAGPDRYSALFNQIGHYCDLTIDAVRAALANVDVSDLWEPGPMPGVLLQHFAHGPAAAGADTGFVRFPPNFVFPRHRHLGREITLVLDGELTDHDGRVYGPGDVLDYPDGTEHTFTVGPDGLTFVICFSGYEPL